MFCTAQFGSSAVSIPARDGTFHNCSNVFVQIRRLSHAKEAVHGAALCLKCGAAGVRRSAALIVRVGRTNVAVGRGILVSERGRDYDRQGSS